MAQTPTAFDTTVLVDLDSDNGMKYKMPRPQITQVRQLYVQITSHVRRNMDVN